MVKHEIMIIANYSEDNTSLTFEELCEICNISSAVMNDLIVYEIIRPIHTHHEQRMIDYTEVQRVKTALRLQRDLEINYAGIALVLDLLNELDELRTKVEFLERHF